jgi:hypothetical protein
MAARPPQEIRKFVAIGILVSTEEGKEGLVMANIPKTLGLETNISPTIFDKTPTEEEIRLAFYNMGEAFSKGLKRMVPK